MAADSLWSPYIFIHELGHQFAGLADEYYTSDAGEVGAFEGANYSAKGYFRSQADCRPPDTG